MFWHFYRTGSLRAPSKAVLLGHSRGFSISTIGDGPTQPPQICNQPMLGFAPGSVERKNILQELQKMKEQIETVGPFKVPLVIGGKEIYTNDVETQSVPFDHKVVLAEFSKAGPEHIKEAIETSLAARKEWEAMPFTQRAAIFLSAADILTNKYRYEIAAATMIGQAKNIWQGEIDSVCELADFWRFFVDDAHTLMKIQPTFDSDKSWGRLEYRGLEGFIYSVSPFNFTAIAGGLCSSPAVMGNVVLWKPSLHSVYSNYIVYKILREAGLPDGVINFIPGNSREITSQVISHPELSGLHFTGSTAVFEQIWKDISSNVHIYNRYPTIVGETGGKNMHFIHESADIEHAVNQTVRGAFEYSGQKCSATSRLYVPSTMWPKFKECLIEKVKNICVGSVYNPETFMSAVINREAYDRISGYIKAVGSSEDPHTKIIVGGECFDNEGYFIHPTVLETTDLKSKTMVNEIFGPVLTAYVYDPAKYKEVMNIAANETTKYGLTGSIFARDRKVVIEADKIFRYSAGNFYINDKCTGALVGSQPFGGSRKSGTNDKAGSIFNILRWVDPRLIKENLYPVLDSYTYPSNIP